MDWDVGALVEDTDKLRNFVQVELTFLNMSRVVVLLSFQPVGLNPIFSFGVL